MKGIRNRGWVVPEKDQPKDEKDAVWRNESCLVWQDRGRGSGLERGPTGQALCVPRSTGSLAVRRRRRRIRDALSYGQIMLRLQGRIWGGKEAYKEALSRVGLVLSQG